MQKIHHNFHKTYLMVKNYDNIERLKFILHNEIIILIHRLNNKPRQDNIWSISIEALRQLIVGNVTSLEGVEAMMLSLIYCKKSGYLSITRSDFEFENYNRVSSLSRTV